MLFATPFGKAMLKALFHRKEAKGARKIDVAERTDDTPVVPSAAILDAAPVPSPAPRAGSLATSDEDLLNALLNDELSPMAAAALPSARSGSVPAATLSASPSRPETPEQAVLREIYQQELLVAHLIRGAGEMLARSALYFPDGPVTAPLRDVNALAIEAESRSRSLILRPEAGAHVARMMAWAGDASAAARAADRAMQVIRILGQDMVATPTLTPLRRVTDLALRVHANVAVALETGEIERAERAAEQVCEMLTACTKARTFLSRTPAVVPVAQERMARAALHCLMVSSVCAARIAHQYSLLATGQATPETVLTGGRPEQEAVRHQTEGDGDLQPLPGVVPGGAGGGSVLRRAAASATSSARLLAA